MRRFHLLFEQSGVFKNTLNSFGHEAYDYDILNEYDETDFQLDLFKEIEEEYNNLVLKQQNQTIFSNLDKKKDFVIAFFPCTHFCDANELQYRLWIGGKKQDYNEKAVNRLIVRNKERAKYFELYLKFTYICKTKEIPTIIENPASSGSGNYLVKFSPIDVGFYEKDRSLFGDNFKKPTNFFAINFEMKEDFRMFTKNYKIKNIYKDTQGCRNRSEISSIYAENFYKRFLEGRV